VPLSFQTTSTNVVLSWTGIAGQTYQVEYKDNLSVSAWTALSGPLTGNGTVLSFTGDFTLSAQRFYRVKVGP
jgi:hypothetical protein